MGRLNPENPLIRDESLRLSLKGLIPAIPAPTRNKEKTSVRVQASSLDTHMDRLSWVNRVSAGRKTDSPDRQPNSIIKTDEVAATVRIRDRVRLRDRLPKPEHIP